MEHTISRTHDTRRVDIRRGPLHLQLEPLFWHPQRYPKRRVAPVSPPLTETAQPREVEDPYRKGHGRVVRLWPTRRAVVVGYWDQPGEPVLEEEQSDRLLAALEGAHIPGITAAEISTWAKATDVALWWQRVLSWVRGQLDLHRPTRARQDSGAPAPAGDFQQYPMIPWPADWNQDAVIDIEDTRIGPPSSLPSAL